MASFDPGKVKSRASYNDSGTFYSLAADFKLGRLYAGCDDFAVHVFDLAKDKKQAVAKWKKHDSYVSATILLTSSSGTTLVSGSFDHRLIWWDVGSGAPSRTLEAHDGWVRSLAATPDGRQIISAGDDMVAKIWETSTGRLLKVLEGHARRTPQDHVNALYAVTVSADGKYVAAADRSGVVCVWEIGTGKVAQRFEVPILYTYDPVQRKRSIGGIRSLAFSPDGELLAAGGIGQVGNVDGLAGPAHVELWNWRKPERRCALGAQGHKGIVNALQFHPKEPWLLGAGGGSDNGFLVFWKLSAIPKLAPSNNDVLAGLRVKTDGHVHALCFHPAKNELYSAGYHKLEIWDLSA